jgi:hypothetical protein
MGYTFEIDAAAGLGRIVADGEADVDTAIETLALFATHEDYRPGLRLLVDLRKLTTKRRAGDVDQITAFLRRSLTLSRMAILAVDPGTAAVQHRVREGLEGEVPVGVFTDPVAAEAWLGQRG